MAKKAKSSGSSVALSATEEAAIRARLPKIMEREAVRHEYLFALPSAVSAYVARELLADARDLPMVHLLMNISVTVLPLAVLCFVVRTHWMGAAYLAFTFGMWAQRFILCLHYSEHRRLFRRQYAPLNLWSNALSALFGLPPGTYYLHHVVMHHLENNVFPYDISSTMPYQRDRVVHFLHYWAKYCLYTFVYLPYYAARRKRWNLLATFTACTALFSALCYYLATRVSGVATFWVLGAPFLVASLALMFGNFAQHIFVDPARPTSTHGLAYNCINHVENLYTFNDGLHHLHHLNSRTHWAELPDTLIRLAPKFAHEDVLVFSGMHFMQVGIAVFTGNYKALYDAFVDLKSDTKRSEAEVTAMLKKRLQPCGDFTYKF